MRAIAIQEFGGAEKLEPMDLPRPQPQRGELLIRVVAAGVNRLDHQICQGRLSEVIPHRFPLIPGWDVAGVVEGFGEQAARYRVGDRVWACARKPQLQWGCYAEYVTVPEQQVSLMPAKLLFEEAASVPLAGLAAYQCLDGLRGIGNESTVLVQGASGGVGHFAVQLARSTGATVFGSCSTRNQDFVFSVGATGVIDHSREPVAEAIRRHFPDGVDVVVDTVGGSTLEQGFAALRPGGRLVSIVEEPDAEIAKRAGVEARFLFVRPDSRHLDHLARLVDEQRLRPHVHKIFSLAEAEDAHRTIESGQLRGKLVLNL